MDWERFLYYCKDFSSGMGKAEFFDRYYESDALFMHTLKGTFYGKDDILPFWSAGHKGIHEVLHPVPEDVLIEE